MSSENYDTLYSEPKLSCSASSQVVDNLWSLTESSEIAFSLCDTLKPLHRIPYIVNTEWFQIQLLGVGNATKCGFNLIPSNTRARLISIDTDANTDSFSDSVLKATKGTPTWLKG